MKPIIHRLRDAERAPVPETVAFSGDELADLLAASIEETIALDTTPKKKRVTTLRTSEPPPPPHLSRPRPMHAPTFATTEFPPMTYTPPSGIPRMSTQPPPRGSFGRSATFGVLGVLLGLAIAAGAWHAKAGSAPLPAPVKHAIVDAKLPLSSPMRDKAKKPTVRRFAIVMPSKTSDPPPAAPDLDKLGDEQMNRPF